MPKPESLHVTTQTLPKRTNICPITVMELTYIGKRLKKLMSKTYQKGTLGHSETKCESKLPNFIINIRFRVIMTQKTIKITKNIQFQWKSDLNGLGPLEEIPYKTKLTALNITSDLLPFVSYQVTDHIAFAKVDFQSPFTQ